MAAHPFWSLNRKNNKRPDMTFTFTSRPSRRNPVTDAATFRVARLWTDEVGGKRREVSHLVDRSYPYQSLRELRWHLAERFAKPVETLDIRRA